MKTRVLLYLMALALVVPAFGSAQGNANFSGTWKLAKIDPPLPTSGRGAGGGGGGGRGEAGGNAYDENAFSAAPATMIITQTPAAVTVQIGSTKGVYKLDNSVTEDPPGNIEALKTWAHWDGAKLHLHQKQGMSFSRDVLSLSAGGLVVLLDLETGGASTTRTLTYTKTS